MSVCTTLPEGIAVGEVWEPWQGGEFLLTVLGFEERNGVTMARCLTLTSNHPCIPSGGIELWHPDNLKSARRLA